jgi:hypothetical protein
MRAPSLSAAGRERLVKILGLLSSSFAGERAAAGLKASTLVKELGAAWDELIVPYQVHYQPSQDRPSQPGAQDWRADLGLCQRHPAHLNPWEAKFTRSLSTPRTSLTRGQATKLAQIADHLRAKGLA